MPAIDDSPSLEKIRAGLQRRMAARLAAWSDERVRDYVADAVYEERRRFSGRDTPAPGEREAIEAAARVLRGPRGPLEAAVQALVALYVGEVHNRFSPRAYRVATETVPIALTRLLTASRPSDLVLGDFDPESRILVRGPLALLRSLSVNHTLILAPTHLSNLDSPLIGYALYKAGLPPFIYGAGLNLFNNPVMAFFMSRLGAYTVDRRKRHRLYKDVLKDYSTERIGRGGHSLFFPGGTRSRSGRVESHVKKGLLGTGLEAWQDGLEAGRTSPEVLVVPCTLSFSLTLEAETLIADSLAEEGKARFIITDDEFSRPRTVASFFRSVLSLDASTHVRFGQPMDLLGNPVDDQGRSLDPFGEVIDRRDYVTDRAGRVVRDEQRDRVYTEQLAASIVRAWHRDNAVQSTHVAAFAAVRALYANLAFRRADPIQFAMLSEAECGLERGDLLRWLARLLEALADLEAREAIRTALPGSGPVRDRAEAVLVEALDRFSRFHSRPALRASGGSIVVDPRLALYYGNRLSGYALEPAVAGQGATT